MDKYCIIDDKIYFNDEFNEKLEPYINIISRFDKLIFCTFPFHETIHSITINDFGDDGSKSFCEFNCSSKFNFDINYLPDCLDMIILSSKFNSYINLDNLTRLKYLIFGYEYNKQTKFVSMNNLTHLGFGYCFNFPLEIEYLKNLTHLKLSEKYNQAIKFPDNLIYLYIGYGFNIDINIPYSIKIIHTNSSNYSIIDYLPNTIEKIIIGVDFDVELNNLPNQIKKLQFEYTSDYSKKLVNLPDSIESIEIGYWTKFIEITNIPKNLKKIKCAKNCIIDSIYNIFDVKYEIENYPD